MEAITSEYAAFALLDVVFARGAYSHWNVPLPDLKYTQEYYIGVEDPDQLVDRDEYVGDGDLDEISYEADYAEATQICKQLKTFREMTEARWRALRMLTKWLGTVEADPTREARTPAAIPEGICRYIGRLEDLATQKFAMSLVKEAREIWTSNGPNQSRNPDLLVLLVNSATNGYAPASHPYDCVRTFSRLKGA
jgi:hypothetical protein